MFLSKNNVGLLKSSSFVYIQLRNNHYVNSSYYLYNTAQPTFILRALYLYTSPPMEEKKQHPAHQDEQWSEMASGQAATIIPVIEEHLTVTKEIVETGKVHIRKTVTQEEATINLPLIQEGYQIERTPGKKELLTQYPPIRHEGENMIIPVVREVLVVEKRYEVLEEVRVIKTKTQVPHLQQVTLLKEAVEVTRTTGNQ